VVKTACAYRTCARAHHMASDTRLHCGPPLALWPSTAVQCTAKHRQTQQISQESRKPLHCMQTRRYSHGYQPLPPHLMIIYYAVKRHIYAMKGHILCDDGPHIMCPGGVGHARPDIEPSGTPGCSLRTAPCMLLLHTEHHNHTAYTCSRMGKPPFTAALRCQL
jgi:hypothetical protein